MCVEQQFLSDVPFVKTSSPAARLIIPLRRGARVWHVNDVQVLSYFTERTLLYLRSHRQARECLDFLPLPSRSRAWRAAVHCELPLVAAGRPELRPAPCVRTRSPATPRGDRSGSAPSSPLCPFAREQLPVLERAPCQAPCPSVSFAVLSDHCGFTGVFVLYSMSECVSRSFRSGRVERNSAS